MSKGLFTAGLGWGIAFGVAAGTFLIAPHLNVSSDAPEETPAETETTQSPADEYFGDNATELVSGILADRPVIVLRQHSADQEPVEDVHGLLEESGAIAAGEIVLTEKFTQPDSIDELESIAAATLPTGSQLSEEGFQPAEVLAAALLLSPEDAEPIASSEDRALVLQSMREAGFIEYEDETILPAQGIVLIAGEDDDAFASDILAQSAEAFDSAGAVTVAAGNADMASRLEELDVHSVDSLEPAWARVSLILSLSQGMDV